MRTRLDAALKAIAARYRAGTQREHAYVRLVGHLERLRDKASLREVRCGLSGAIHRIHCLAKRERERR